MFTSGSQPRARSWSVGPLRTATFIALIAGYGAFPTGQAAASARTRAVMAQSGNDDPCRYATADAMGSAFGRQMKSSTLTNVCQYRGAGSDLVVVKVAAGPEGTILRHVKAASAQNQKGVEKVTTALPVFIGRVGDHEVQIETTIQPLPRDAMIVTGKRIMETLARQ